MDIIAIIRNLEKEWDLETGFFGKLRMGDFDPIALEQVLFSLKSIEMNNESMIDRRLVSLTWYIPIFMSWQRERFQHSKNELANFDQAINQLTSLLEFILGIP